MLLCVRGLMDVTKFLVKYPIVSRRNMEKIRDTIGLRYFGKRVSDLHKRRETEKEIGRPQVQSMGLLQVLSVNTYPVSTSPVSTVEKKSVYGRIYGEVSDIVSRNFIHDLYKRDSNDAEALNSSGSLTLISPASTCWWGEAFMPLGKTRIVVELFDGGKNLLVQDFFSLEDGSEDDYEQVKSKCVQGNLASFVMRYVVIPFGLFCRIEIGFSHRSYAENEKHRFINVSGKVVARYSNTFGNYSSEECVVFEKRPHEFEQVSLEKSMSLLRPWMALPAYSSLVLNMDLWEFETGKKIVREIIELKAQNGFVSCESFEVDDDTTIAVSVFWFPGVPEGPHKVQQEEYSDDEMSSCSNDESSDDESSDVESSNDESSNIGPSWGLCSHKLFPSQSLEVFSVFIGSEKSQALHIYGSIEVLYADETAFYLFKRDEKDALRISGHRKTLPMLDGPRLYEDPVPLEMKFDLKDVDGRLSIKGYVDWDAEDLDNPYWQDKQLCSVIQGERGFAAIHYTIFSGAIQVNIEVSCIPKMGSVDVSPTVYGSLAAHYSSYKYSSRYNKDYYQSVLFRRIQDDSIQVTSDGILPLSRSTVVVPSFSSLIIDVDLSIGISDQKLLCTKEFEIGAKSRSMETEGCFVHIKLEWSEVK